MEGEEQGCRRGSGSAEEPQGGADLVGAGCNGPGAPAAMAGSRRIARRSSTERSCGRGAERGGEHHHRQCSEWWLSEMGIVQSASGICRFRWLKAKRLLWLWCLCCGACGARFRGKPIELLSIEHCHQ